MNRSLEDIYQNEIHPDHYLRIKRESRLRRIEEALGTILLLSLLGALFAFTQVAYGIW